MVSESDVVGGRRWPRHPALLPDETFSSWFARLAADNGMLPADLYRAIKPGAHARPRDLDRHVEPDLLAMLAVRTGVCEATLRQATFIRWSGLVFEEDDGRNKLHWLPVAGSAGGKRSFGQQFCPACLREDGQPHFRLYWRLSFVTACARHRILLADRCPRCGEPIHVLGSELGRPVRCWKCEADLAQALQHAEIDLCDLQYQRWLLEIAATGWAPFEGYGPVYSFTYFRILMLIFRLLATGSHADILRAWTADRLGISPPNVWRLKQVELLNTRSRHELLRLAAHLLEDWPRRFIEACEAVGITKTHLIKGERSYPFAFAHAVDWHLKDSVRIVRADEVRAAIAYLRARGRSPTFGALTDLFGVKPTTHRTLVEPATRQARYGHGRYWKLDGVSSDIRIAAREAAILSGESLGAWVENALRSAIENMKLKRSIT